MAESGSDHHPHFSNLTRGLIVAAAISAVVWAFSQMLGSAGKSDIARLLEAKRYAEVDAALAALAAEGQGFLGQNREADALRLFLEMRDQAFRARQFAIAHEGTPTASPGKGGETGEPVASPEKQAGSEAVMFAGREAEACSYVALVQFRELERKYAAKFVEAGDTPFVPPPQETQPILAEIQRGLALDTSSSELYFLQGSVCDRMGLFQKAIEALDKAIGIDERNAAAYNRRGLAYVKLRDFEKARENFEAAKMASGGAGPAYVDSLFNLGRYHERLHAFHKQEAGKDGSGASLEEMRKHREKAIRYLREFLEQEKGSPAAEQARGDLDALVKEAE